MMEYIMWILSNAEKIAAFLALAGTAWAVIHFIFAWTTRKIVVPIVSVKDNVDTLLVDTGHLKTDFLKMNNRLGEVEKELKSNGGGSLKDAVKRVEEETKSQTKKLIKLEKGHAQLRKGQLDTRTKFLTPMLDAAKLDALTSKKTK